MEKRVLIIHNPVAGQRTANKVSLVCDALRARGADVTMRATGFAGEAEKIVHASRNSGFDVIAVAGGDGTLMEAVNGLERGDEQKLAIIPAGTANVVALELGLPAPAEKLAEVIFAGNTKRIETAQLNGRRFVFTAGAGFDAHVVATINPWLKRKAGKIAFVAAALKALFSYKFEPIELDVDGSTLTAAGVIVVNGRYYGGPFVAAPDNDLGKKGLAALALLKPGRIAALKYVTALGRGKLHEAAGVKYFPAARAIKIAGPAGVPVQADGDHVGDVPADISADAGAVNLIC